MVTTEATSPKEPRPMPDNESSPKRKVFTDLRLIIMRKQKLYQRCNQKMPPIDVRAKIRPSENLNEKLLIVRNIYSEKYVNINLS